MAPQGPNKRMEGERPSTAAVAGSPTQFSEEALFVATLGYSRRLRVCAFLVRTVRNDCAIELDGNAYSVPWRLIGEQAEAADRGRARLSAARTRCGAPVLPARHPALRAWRDATSNCSVSEWGVVFADPVVATAILDRLLHHSHVITIRGDSYRLKAKRRSGLLQKAAAAEPTVSSKP
jgi:hypothetical protein